MTATRALESRPSIIRRAIAFALSSLDDLPTSSSRALILALESITMTVFPVTRALLRTVGLASAITPMASTRSWRSKRRSFDLVCRLLLEKKNRHYRQAWRHYDGP